MRTARLESKNPGPLGTGPHRTLESLRPESREQRSLESLVFEASPVATFVVWATGGELLVNGAARAVLGLGARDRVRSLGELQTLLAVTDETCSLARTLRGDAVPPSECRVQLPGGERVLVLEARPLLEDSVIVGAIATARDITEEMLETEMADELLGRAAHDLRTPLTALKASAQLVARGLERLDAAARARTFQLMLAQVEKLASRIDEVVDAARIRRGRYDVSPAGVDVSQTMREIVGELERAHAAPKVVLEAPDGVMASIDPARLRQIFVRLGAETVDHEGTLTVTVAPSDGGACITVDTAEQPIQRTTRQLARSIVGRLGGRTEEPTPARLIMAFPAATSG